MLSDGRVKISDFGISEIIESFTERYSRYVTCPLHKSPEILQGVKYSSKCDVWSLGLVFYEMLYGISPWTGRY
jgi:serine/threonine-protein kinase ULK/ATG1